MFEKNFSQSDLDGMSEREKLMYPFQVKGILGRREKQKGESVDAFSSDCSGIPRHVLKEREETYIDGRLLLDEQIGHLQFEDRWEGIAETPFSDDHIVMSLKLSC